MKTLLPAAAALLLAANPVYAGTIFGTVVGEDGAPLARVAVYLQCPPLPTAPTNTRPDATTDDRGSYSIATTDDRGSYSIATSAHGTCRVLVGVRAADVIVYANPTRYNLRIAGNRLELR